MKNTIVKEIGYLIVNGPLVNSWEKAECVVNVPTIRDRQTIQGYRFILIDWIYDSL